jgi:hypothetical protein
VKIEAIRPGRAHHRRKPAVADGEVIGERVVVRQLAAVVIAHDLGAVLVAVASDVFLDEAVVLAAAKLGVTGVPAVRGIFGLVVEELADLDEVALAIGVGLAAAEPVGPLATGIAPVLAEHAQVVVKRAVLHHQHHHRIDAGEQLFGRPRQHLRQIRRLAQVQRLTTQVRGLVIDRDRRFTARRWTGTADRQGRQPQPQLRQRPSPGNSTALAPLALGHGRSRLGRTIGQWRTR